MPQELFESIVDQALAISGDRLVVFLSNYNEPTFDPLFDERIRYLFDRRIGVSILTNASRFTPERSALFETLGRFRYIGVNLPTLRPERYEMLHGTRDLARVLANMDAITSDLADEIAIVVLGHMDDEHRRDIDEIRARFEPKGWKIRPFPIRSRPGSGTYVPEPPARRKLRGCDLMGSRPFEHLHVTATGKAVLCCQDYYEAHAHRRLEDSNHRRDPRRRHDRAPAPLGLRRRGGPRGLHLPPLRVFAGRLIPHGTRNAFLDANRPR